MSSRAAAQWCGGCWPSVTVDEQLAACRMTEADFDRLTEQCRAAEAQLAAAAGRCGPPLAEAGPLTL